MFPKWSDWNLNYTKKGLFKLYLRRGLKALLPFAAVAGVYRARSSGVGPVELVRLLRSFVVGGVVNVLDASRSWIAGLQ